MSKSFWEGFRKGFLNASGYGLALALGVAIGYFLPQQEKPAQDLENTEECVFIIIMQEQLEWI